MKKLLTLAALGAIMGVTSIAPVEAMPNANPTVRGSTDVQQARVVVRYGYWRGHRGYRDRRPGYRMYNGFWYPPAAFVVVTPRRAWYWCGPRWNRHRCWR